MKVYAYHFIVLAIILAGGMYTFFLVANNTHAQFLVGVITSIAYVSWGILHHALHRDLHPKVVIEYVLVCAVAILVLANVLRP